MTRGADHLFTLTVQAPYQGEADIVIDAFDADVVSSRYGLMMNAADCPPARSDAHDD